MSKRQSILLVEASLKVKKKFYPILPDLLLINSQLTVKP